MRHALSSLGALTLERKASQTEEHQEPRGWLRNSRRLRNLIPRDILFVSESGVKTPEDVQRLKQIGADAALIGETLMRAEDTAAKLQELIHNS